MKVRRLAGDVTVGEACGYGGGEWVKSLTIYEGKLREERMGVNGVIFDGKI